MQFFSIILGIAYLGMGIVQISAIADGIHAWLGWDGLLAGFLAFILGYFPLIGSICGVAGAYYAWGWGLIPSIALFFWYIPLIIAFFVTSSFQNYFENKKHTKEVDAREIDICINDKNFFHKIINGDVSLPIIFWIYGVAVSTICKMFIKSKFAENFFATIYHNYDLIGVKVVGIAYDTFLIVYTIIICIGVWRSANKYTGHFIWAAIAKFFSILWMLSIIIIVADIFSLINMQLPESTEELPQWRLEGYKKSIDSLINH